MIFIANPNCHSKLIISIIYAYIIKVEAPVVDHLRDLGAEGEEFEVVENFPM